MPEPEASHRATSNSSLDRPTLPRLSRYASPCSRQAMLEAEAVVLLFSTLAGSFAASVALLAVWHALIAPFIPGTRSREDHIFLASSFVSCYPVRLVLPGAARDPTRARARARARAPSPVLVNRASRARGLWPGCTGSQPLPHRAVAPLQRMVTMCAWCVQAVTAPFLAVLAMRGVPITDNEHVMDAPLTLTLTLTLALALTLTLTLIPTR